MKRPGLLAIAFAATAATLSAQTNGRPDLSGTWLFSIDLPPVALKTPDKWPDVDQDASTPAAGVRRLKTWRARCRPRAAPVYKPEFRAKVKDLLDHESKTDQVFYCGRPGVPRIGPPRRIIQLPNEWCFSMKTSRAIRIA